MDVYSWTKDPLSLNCKNLLLLQLGFYVKPRLTCPCKLMCLVLIVSYLSSTKEPSYHIRASEWHRTLSAFYWYLFT